MADNSDETTQDEKQDDVEPLATEQNTTTHKPSIRGCPNNRVDQLSPHEVRWVYKKEGEKRWQPLDGWDSLAVEASYRKMQIAATDASHAKQPSKDVDAADDAVVLKNLYRASLRDMVIKPIFWEEPHMQLRRGIWFAISNWQPLDSDLADFIETQYINHFKSAQVDPESELTSKRDKRQRSIIYQVNYKDKEIQWFSPVDCNLIEIKSQWRIKQILGLKSRVKIQRGYHSAVSEAEKPSPVTHLIFVVHGIGQTRSKNSIVSNTNKIRQTAEQMQTNLMPDVKKRIVFLPVEWRSRLKLAGEVVPSITPKQVENLRQFLNRTMLDILYYTSPIYRNEVVNGLSRELNRLYGLFLAFNPDFEKMGGQVSVIGHSLGSVIVYDVITSWSPVKLYEKFLWDKIIESLKINGHVCDDAKRELDSIYEKIQQIKNNVAEADKNKEPLFKFKVANLFCIGSPLGIFLALRDFKSNEILPKGCGCQRLFNIYHVTDPVAYRLEPLLNTVYAGIQAVQIYRWQDAAKNWPYFSERKEVKIVLPSKDKAKPTKRSHELRMSKSEMQLVTNGRKQSNALVLPKRLQNSSKKSESTDELSTLSSTGTGNGRQLASESTLPANQRLRRRVDFVLIKHRMQHQYWAAMTAHWTYWKNADCIALILMQILHNEEDKCLTAIPNSQQV